MHQFNAGKWLGAYYTQMQFSASYLTPVNFAMLAATLWSISRAQITDIASWLNFPLFMGIALFTLLIIIPLLDYIFVMKPRMTYQNQQSWIHNNPGAEQLKRIEEKLDKINRGEKW